MTDKQELYFEIRYKEKVTDYKKVSRVSSIYLGKDINENEARKKYKKGGINKFICDAIYKKHNDFGLEKLNEIKEFFNDYHKKYTLYFNKNRKAFFDNYNECMKWFEKQGCKCGYCGVTQKELDEIVEKRKENFTLNNKTKRSKGTLEIEKKDSNIGYEIDNMILACPLCNNAKSNLIDEVSWRNIFVKPMRDYYKKILEKDLDNPIPMDA